MNFWKLWAASTIFNLGDGVTLVAGPLLAASLTRDPVLVAGVAFVQRLPWLLLSLISGALVDRLDLEKANGQLFGAQIVANEFAASPLGGFLFAIAGVRTVLL